jgi:hypothetical protein
MNAGMSAWKSAGRDAIIVEETRAIPGFSARSGLIFRLDFTSIGKFFIIYALRNPERTHRALAQRDSIFFRAN